MIRVHFLFLTRLTGKSVWLFYLGMREIRRMTVSRRHNDRCVSVAISRVACFWILDFDSIDLLSVRVVGGDSRILHCE